LHQPPVSAVSGTLRVRVPLRQDDDESLSAGRSARGRKRQCKGSNRFPPACAGETRLTRLCRPSRL